MITGLCRLRNLTSEKQVIDCQRSVHDLTPISRHDCGGRISRLAVRGLRFPGSWVRAVRNVHLATLPTRNRHWNGRSVALCSADFANPDNRCPVGTQHIRVGNVSYRCRARLVGGTDFLHGIRPRCFPNVGIGIAALCEFKCVHSCSVQ